MWRSSLLSSSSRKLVSTTNPSSNSASLISPICAHDFDASLSRPQQFYSTAAPAASPPPSAGVMKPVLGKLDWIRSAGAIGARDVVDSARHYGRCYWELSKARLSFFWWKTPIWFMLQIMLCHLLQVNHALLEEIREINQRLIDTIVDISSEDIDPTAAAAAAAEGGEGTIVKCSFSAIALSPNLKSQYASAQMSPIQPLRLLVPTNYPNSSPILLDKFPIEISKEHEDLSIKAKSRFSISLRNLSQPMSLGDIARTWDICARAVISEYAQQSHGGTFSSKYGTWENCLSAA